MRIDWEKKPTYEEIIRDLEKDYKVKLPDRVALNFYDSFAHTQFQQMQQSISTSQQNIDDGGEPLSKSARKKLAKALDKHRKVHAAAAAAGDGGA